jgi:hypothetical protein
MNKSRGLGFRGTHLSCGSLWPPPSGLAGFMRRSGRSWPHRSAAHRPLGEKMHGQMPQLAVAGRSQATARHCALRRRGRSENTNHHRCYSMKVRAPVRGPTATPVASFFRSPALGAEWVRMVGTRVRRWGRVAGFVWAEKPRHRWIQMSGWRWSGLNRPRWENRIPA